MRVLFPAARIKTRRLSIRVSPGALAYTLKTRHAQRFRYIEYRAGEPVWIVADDSIFSEQIAFHDIQPHCVKPGVISVDDSRVFGLVPLESFSGRHAVVEQNVRKQKTVAVFGECLNVVRRGKSLRLARLSHDVLDIDLRAARRLHGIDDSVDEHVRDQTGVQRTRTDRD